MVVCTASQPALGRHFGTRFRTIPRATRLCCGGPWGSRRLISRPLKATFKTSQQPNGGSMEITRQWDS